MEFVIFGIVLGFLGLVGFAVWYYAATIIRALADRNILVTYPLETTSKAIMRNGRLAFFVLAFKGHCFAGEIDHELPEPKKWDIVVGDAGPRPWLPLLKGIRWVGLPPFSEVYKYRFSWASLEEQTGKEDLAKKPVLSEKVIDYIFVRDDVYATKLEGAECSDNIPLNATLLVGGRIVNPYKALFAIERWLEASLNVVDSRMRSFFGGKSYVELRAIAEAMRAGTGGTSTHELSNYFHEVMAEIKEKWGFEISFIQIYSVDPGSDLADEFIRATTKVYVAQQQRDADVALGDGLAARDKKHFDAIANIPNGPELFKWQSIRESGLTTYVEGGGVGVTIPVDNRPRTKTDGTPPVQPANQ